MKPTLFIDFDGTLCFDRFWQQLPQHQYELVQQKLFKENWEIVDGWMKAEKTAEEVTALLSEMISIPFPRLWNILEEGCKTMKVSQVTLNKINSLRHIYRTVLMTDNMDTFDRFTVPSLELDRYFDTIINSYNKKQSKNKNDGELYRLSAGVDMKQCVLIDNAPNTCKLFANMGGKALLATEEQDVNFHLNTL
jgi:FMN phosphatase YigB (HAD superfamily)